MKVIYMLGLLFLNFSGFAQNLSLEDQLIGLSGIQKDSLRKELDIAVDVSDIFISTNYKNESNLELLYLLVHLDNHFYLNKTLADESKLDDARGNVNYIMRLYGKSVGVLPNSDIIESNLNLMKQDNFDDFLNNDITISVWSEIAGKYPMPKKALESMSKYYNGNAFLQAKGLLAFYHLSQNQHDKNVQKYLEDFRLKVVENLNKPINELNNRNGWAWRVVNMASYLYVTQDKNIPILDWTKELKYYLKNGYGAMSGSEFEAVDKFTNIYGLWAVLELRERVITPK